MTNTKALALLMLMAAWLLLIAGCAHVSQVDTQCCLTDAIVQTVTKDLQGADYETTLAQLVADKGLCVVEASVDQVIASFNAKAELSVVLQHAVAWRAEHPSPKTAP